MKMVEGVRNDRTQYGAICSYSLSSHFLRRGELQVSEKPSTIARNFFLQDVRYRKVSAVTKKSLFDQMRNINPVLL